MWIYAVCKRWHVHENTGTVNVVQGHEHDQNVDIMHAAAHSWHASALSQGGSVRMLLFQVPILHMEPVQASMHKLGLGDIPDVTSLLAHVKP